MIDLNKRYLIVIPVNGYVNRLQAIISGMLLASQFGFVFKVYWIPERIAPADIDKIFSSDFVREYSINSSEWLSLAKIETKNFPKYLSITDKAVFIQGLDNGEQKYIKQIFTVDFPNSSNNIYIKSGSNFYATILNDLPGFQLAKRNRFNLNSFNESLLKTYEEFRLNLPSIYIGLHLRTTDRILEFPPDKKLLKRVLESMKILKISDVFISTDSVETLSKWTSLLEQHGLKVYSQSSVNYNRSNVDSAQSAFIDWLSLLNCNYLIYTGNSTFSEEASVLSKTILGKFQVKNNFFKVFVNKIFTKLKTKIYVKFFV